MVREDVLKFIDFSKLSKDYLTFNDRKIGELPDYNDFYYLYIDLNLSPFHLSLFFQTKVSNIYVWAKKLNIKKSKTLSDACRKNTCLEKYGAESPVQNLEIKEKIKNTCLGRYGEDNIFKKSKYIKKKFFEKYGTSNPMKVPEILSKYKKNYSIKTGCDFPLKNKDVQEKIKNTVLQRYSVDNPMKNKDVAEKSKLTRLNKYNEILNHKNFIIFRDKLSSSVKNALIKNPNIILQRKKTLQERYGDSNYNNREKSKQTKLIRYGDSSYNNREKAKNITLLKYGYENPSQADSVKIKKSLTFQKHYNKNHYFQTEEFIKRSKQVCLEKYGNEVYTKIKNSSFSTSKPELEIYSLLLQKFPDTKTQYCKDKRYPFNCDFYIPSQDLFIEINFHWTHGKEPFNENNPEHLEILSSWYDKKTKFYQTAFHVWSEADPLKRRTAKENNLNYLEFFNMKQFLEWFNC